MSDQNIFRENFSAKIKRVFIELHDFTYSHGPTDTKELSGKKFIGRKRRIEKFKSVLTDSSKRTGTYLVAGYKGMGKTSFVNKVLNEIQPPKHHGVILKTLTWIFLYVFLSTFMAYLTNTVLILIINLLFLVISTVILSIELYSSSLKTNYNTIINLIEKIKSGNWAHFFYSTSSTQNNRLKKSCTFIVIGSFLTIMALEFSPISIAHIYISIYILSFLTIYLIIITKYLTANINSFSNYSKKPDYSFENKLIDLVKLLLNNKRKIIIKLNLGYSNLKEIDILKLIARNLKTIYLKEKLPLLWRSVIFLFTLILSYNMVTSPYNKLNDYLKENSSITDYFPSQKKNFILSKENFLEKISDELDSTNKFSTVNYLSKAKHYDWAIKIKINAVLNTKDLNNKKKEKLIDSVYQRTNYEGLTKEIRNDNNYDFSFKGLRTITSYLDLFIYQSYNELRGTFETDKLDFNLIGSVLPNHLNYLFFVYFILIWLLIKVIIYNSGKRSYYFIAKQIHQLNDIIDSKLTTEQSAELNNIATFLKLIRKSNKQYHIADEREIEKQLIEIVENISFLPIFSKRLDFIIVFDELDKIEPGLESTEKASSDKYPSSENSKYRLQATLSLLSNLKYFLSTAKAKFIFIAGREIYDAFLADVSDRNFHINSIFNDVFYLNSFFRDTEEIGFGNTTIRTEEFVCQFLFPKNSKYDYNLKAYNKYLIDEFKDIFGEEKDDISNLISKQKREKIIYLLQQFITYLTHLSNGAPGKMNAIFEDYVVKMRFREEITNKSLYVGKYVSNHYLFFDFNEQYKLGLFNYLLTPIDLTINKHARYSDKLLVSASFLIDHILKFHRDSFSWRNVESAPELIDINKTPELRELIDNIMQHLCRTHISKIINNLNDFKFSNKTAQEITFLSRMSEDASAAFNFSLDSLQSVKKYYLERISNFKNSFSRSQDNTKASNYINSEESLLISIGDLFFYDGDYSNAISHYSNAIQFLRNETTANLSLTHMFLLTRNILKLGMALEKRKTFDNALMTYGEISHKIMKYLQDKVDYNNTNVNDPFANFKFTALESVRVFYQPLLARLYLIEKRGIDGATKTDIERVIQEFEEIREKLDTTNKNILDSEFYNRIGDFLYFKNASSIFDRMFKKESNIELYNRLKICKAKRLVENNTEVRCRTACNACFFYHGSLKYFLLSYIPSLDMNDTLKINKGFFLNSIFNLIINKSIKSEDFKAFSTLGNLLSDLGDVLFSCSSKKDFISHIFLESLLSLLEDSGNPNMVYNYIEKFDDNNKPARKLESSILYFYLSSYFYKRAGDFKNHALMFTKILYLFKDYLGVIHLKIGSEFKNLNKLQKIKLYRIIIGLNQKIKNSNISVISNLRDLIKIDQNIWKNLKFLNSIRLIIISYLVNKTNIERILELIAHKSIRSSYSAYDNVHACEINKLKGIYDSSAKSIPLAEHIKLNKNSISPDTNEITILHQNIHSLCRSIEINLFGKAGIPITNREPFNYKRLVENSNYTPYATVANMYNRILLLKYRAQYNISLLEFNGIKIPNDVSDNDRYSKLLLQFYNFVTGKPEIKGLQNIISYLSEKNEVPDIHKQFVEYILVDTLFCLFEAVKFNNIFGRTYGINHFNAATTHYNLWRISEAYEVYIVMIELGSTVWDMLKNKKNEKENSVNQKIEDKNTIRDNKAEVEDKRNSFIQLEEIIEQLNNLIEKLPASENIKYAGQANFKDFLNKIIEDFKKVSIGSENQKLNEKSIQELMKDLIEDQNIPFINPIYQCEKSLREFYSSIETHSNGTAYHNLIENMYYLNDDFNDEFCHFKAASERYMINTAFINWHIENLSNRIKQSKIYKLESYSTIM
jgi:hypothetical protein